MLILLLLAGWQLSAQSLTDGRYPSVKEYARTHPEIYQGNYRTYRFAEPSPLCPPKGYEPVYISHYGRHGSRFFVWERDYAKFYQMFQKADTSGFLTPEGQAFWKEFAPAYEKTIKGNASQLTTLGGREQAILAYNMLRRYPSVFSDSARVDARSTDVERVIASMDAFCSTLQNLRSDLRVTMDHSKKQMTVLHCVTRENPAVTSFDLDNLGGRRALWRDDYLALREEMDTLSFFPRMFGDFDVSSYGWKKSLIQTFYNICADGPCISPSYQWLRFLKEDEVYPIWRVTNLKFYAIAGPSRKYSKGRAPALMYPLLEDIVSLADRDLDGKDCAARLRFGHDYQLVSLLSLLDVPGWNTPCDDPDAIENVFRYNLITMASNLQFVFYRGKRGDYLVRVLFNDNDLPLPLRRVSRVYYRWKDLREYLSGRIAWAQQHLDLKKTSILKDEN